MPYFDLDAVLAIQIRDRLRDLLEADDLVIAVYAKPIEKIESESLTEAEESRASLKVYAENFGIAASQTHQQDPKLLLMVQQFLGAGASFDKAVALDALITKTNVIRGALLRYQSDPSPLLPGQECRLWDAMSFPSDTTSYDVVPDKFYYSLTVFQLSSYQRNP